MNRFNAWQKKIAIFMAAISFVLLGASDLRANELDNISTCAGIVIGNAVIDLSVDDDEAFVGGVSFAVTAYAGQLLSQKYSQEDAAFSEKLIAANTDKVTIASNTGTFNNELYEEIVGCYRLLGLSVLRTNSFIEARQSAIDDRIQKTMSLIRRALSAG